MFLRSLRLVNYRKFKDVFLEFPDGVTGIVGLNGSGKSSLFEGMAWVLYGSPAVRTSVEEIKRVGAAEKESCRVELEFEMGEETYKVVREMRGRSRNLSASVSCNGSMVADGASAVSGYIARLLGMDVRSFFTSVFAKQNELNALSSMNPSDRRPLILRMLGVDRLDDVLASIRSDRKQHQGMIDRWSSEIVDADGADRLEVWSKELLDLKARKKKVDASGRDAREKASALRAQIDEQRDVVRSLKQVYEGILKKRNELEIAKTKREKKVTFECELKALEKRLEEELRVLEERRKDLLKFGDIEKRIEAEEKSLKACIVELENITGSLRDALGEKKILQGEIRRVKQKKSRLEKMGAEATCPTCERLLGDQYGLLMQDFKSELFGLEEDLEGVSKQSIVAQKSEQKAGRMKAEVESSLRNLHKQMLVRERLMTEIKGLERSVRQRREEREGKSEEISRLKDISFDVLIFDAVKAELKESYARWQKEVAVLSELQERSSRAGVILERARGDSKVLNEKIKAKKEHMKKQKEIIVKLDGERACMARLSVLYELMSGFRVHVISQIRPALSLYASELFDVLTQGRYSEVELDEGYNLMVYDGGTSFGISRYSGGEEDLANLCVRLAISEVLSERSGGIFDFIVLDEIFGSQDTVRRQNIARSFGGLSGRFRQVFLITHVEEVRSFLDNILIVFESEDGCSRVRVE